MKYLIGKKCEQGSQNPDFSLMTGHIKITLTHFHWSAIFPLILHHTIKVSFYLTKQEYQNQTKQL